MRVGEIGGGPNSQTAGSAASGPPQLRQSAPPIGSNVMVTRVPYDQKPTKPQMPAVRPQGHYSAHVGPASTAHAHVERAEPPPSAREAFKSGPHSNWSLELDAPDLDDVPTAVNQGLSSTPPLAPATRDRAALIRLDGATAGQTVMLRKDTLVRIGRGRDAEMRVDDDGVSRLHAAIRFEQGAFVLTDLGSRNGTVVQGQRIVRRNLADGDLIHIGPRTSFRFQLMAAQEEELYRQLFESSVRDPLTGAYNRLHFDERLRSEIAFGKRHQTNMSLLLFDLDHFKRVNDTYGHPAGDAVLKYVAAVVQLRLRTEDVFARYGGEEFAVILRGIDLLGAGRAGERLRGAIGGGAASYEGRLVPVTISVGCAALTCCEPRECEEMIRIADRRLYAAKHNGRNRVVAFD